MILNKFIKQDYVRLLFQWFWTLLVGIILCIITKQTPEIMMVYSMLTILYIICFSFAFEHYYTWIDDGIDIHWQLQRCIKWYCIALTLCALGSALPYNIHLYLVVGGLLCSVMPLHLGMVQSLFIVITTQMCTNINGYEVIFAILLVMIGMLCTSVFSKYKFSFESALIIASVSVVSCFMSAYCIQGTINVYLVIHGLLEAMINLAILLPAIPFLTLKKQTIQTISYGEAIEDDFSMALVLKALSNKKYIHGRKVSMICYECGKRLGLDENLACCGGLYYCLCDSDEVHPVEYALKLADEHQLPVEVRRLMMQYHGIKDEISTPEAAMVDLIDEVISRMERTGAVCTDNFQKQMLIMNTFEELSASGRYDHSGLSINMFIKIRNYLIEEVDYSDIVL